MAMKPCQETQKQNLLDDTGKRPTNAHKGASSIKAQRMEAEERSPAWSQNTATKLLIMKWADTHTNTMKKMAFCHSAFWRGCLSSPVMSMAANRVSPQLSRVPSSKRVRMACKICQSVCCICR